MKNNDKATAKIRSAQHKTIMIDRIKIFLIFRKTEIQCYVYTDKNDYGPSMKCKFLEQRT